jgi:hypothetical protein
VDVRQSHAFCKGQNARHCRTPLNSAFGVRGHKSRNIKVVAMPRDRIADAMLTWLRAEESRSRTTERAMFWVGCVVFVAFLIFFLVMAVVMVIGILAPDAIDAPSRWSSFAYLSVAAGGATFLLWRLRRHVRLHSRRTFRQEQRAEVTNIMELDRHDGESR